MGKGVTVCNCMVCEKSLDALCIHIEDEERELGQTHGHGG